MLGFLVLVATAAVVPVASSPAEVRTVRTTLTAPAPAPHPPPCRFLWEEKGGRCVPTAMEVEKAMMSTRHKRQLVVNSDCPRCVPGIFDLYPRWDDCTKFTYCLNGNNFQLDCAHFNASYFNPVTKACEAGAQPSNLCIYRWSTVLLDRGAE